MSSEEIFIDGVIRKRNDAVKALYDRFAPVLLGLCCRYCENREDAEDVLHEGFIKIIRHLPSFRARNEGSLQAWMKRIMVNTALNHLRSRNRQAFDADTVTATEDPEDEDHGKFAPILAKLSRERILGMIKALPAGYRAVFNLFVFEEFSHKEIAETLNFSENTSKSQLSKARALLRKKIEEALSNEKASVHGKAKASY